MLCHITNKTSVYFIRISFDRTTQYPLPAVVEGRLQDLHYNKKKQIIVLCICFQPATLCIHPLVQLQLHVFLITHVPALHLETDIFAHSFLRKRLDGERM